MKRFHVLIAILMAFTTTHVIAAPGESQQARKDRVVKHWTPERRAAAIPRDLVIDARGKGYIRMRHGTLLPHGHNTPARMGNIIARKGPPGGGGNNDTEATFSGRDPADGENIAGTSVTFQVDITDDDGGVKSATLVIVYPNGTTTQSFSMTRVSEFDTTSTWTASISSFTDGAWGWYVTTRDRGPKGGGSSESDTFGFNIGSGGGSGGGGYQSDGPVIPNSNWLLNGPAATVGGGAVQKAAGRIYFEMPTNPKRKRWAGYVCSGTVIKDGADGSSDVGDGRAVVITAAHCVYDDAYKAFARNVLFIPDQASGGSATDRNCSNDPHGCWTPALGVVDVDWTTRTFPNNVEWDFAYYVFADNSHSGFGPNGPLDATVGDMAVDFGTPAFDVADSTADHTHGLGYSYSEDPNFMFCAQDMTTESAVNWWLPDCGLSGGSSGGPWVQPMTGATGDGPIISVNSWGYTGAPGMAGPRLDDTSAACLLDEIRFIDPATFSAADGDEGIAVDNTTCPE